VLLPNGNSHLSIPIAHSVHMQETYENIVLLLRAKSYSNYGWKICGGFKVIGLLLGMQSGHIQLCCCLCEWSSQAKYKTKDWPMRENLVPGEKCASNQLPVDKG